jgi:uncharacterized membrane protein YfcA
MITDWQFYLVAIPAVMANGMGKGGFSGVGALSLPLMSLVVSPIQAVAITLPILMSQDVVSIWAYRNSFDRRTVLMAMPGLLLGIGIGTLLATRVSNEMVQLMVGCIAAGFSVLSSFSARRGDKPVVAPRGKILFWSTVGGFTSFVANAGGPPMQVWMMPQQLRPAAYAGSMSIMFGIVNWVKFIIFIALGQVTLPNLSTSAALLPVAVASTFLGVWMVQRLSGARFYPIVRALTFLVGLKLIWDGAHGVLGRS